MQSQTSLPTKLVATRLREEFNKHLLIKPPQNLAGFVAQSFLWCLLNPKYSKHTKACGPTGISATNIELSGTAVGASTLHALFDLDSNSESKLDFSETTTEKVAALIGLKVFCVDEVRTYTRACCASSD